MVEDLFDIINSKREIFTNVENIIADYFLSGAPAMSIEDLSQTLSVSTSSITRFSKKIGLDNYKELIFMSKISRDNDKEINVSSISVTEMYYSILKRVQASYNEKSIEQICECLHRGSIIYFLGTGFNSFVGNDFQFKFSRIGKNVINVNDDNSIKLAASLVKGTEVAIICSMRGNRNSLLEAAQKLHQKSVPLLFITANLESEIKNYADLTLHTAFLSEKESYGNISPQIPMLIQMDIIYNKYVKMYKSSIGRWINTEKILNE